MEGDYAFIGLGVMGYGMASNIRQSMPSLSTLYIYDIDRAVCEAFTAKFGASGPVKIVGSAKEAAQKATVVISNLPTVEAVRSTYLDFENGVINAPANPDRLLIETSTIEPSVARELSINVAESRAGIYVDCPVSGGPSGAAGGNLSVMIGRKKPLEHDEAGRRISNLVGIMSDPDKVFWCGKVGHGLAAKISNNYIACTVMLAVAEATAIGVRSGIEPGLLHDVIRHSSGQTFIGDTLRNSAKAYFQSGAPFPVDLMIKDIDLVVNAGHETEVNPRMALAAQEIWKEAAKDPSVLNWDGFRGL